MKNLFVFDVESTYLYGEGFAVGVVVYSRIDNKIIDTFDLMSVEGYEKAKQNDWVNENVLPHLSSIKTVLTTKELRDQFYDFYLKYKDNSEVYSDVNFPVETQFLTDVVNDDIGNRMWNMPYPLKDISSEVDVSIDRNEYSELQDLKKHHPLDDARASLYSLLKHRKE